MTKPVELVSWPEYVRPSHVYGLSSREALGGGGGGGGGGGEGGGEGGRGGRGGGGRRGGCESIRS